MITRDLYQRYLLPRRSDREGILVARTTIVVVVALGVLIGGSGMLKLIIT
jgi:Na+/proline symporter